MDQKQVYLLLVEKKVFSGSSGERLSKPSLSFVAINDFHLLKENGFYEKEGYSVEILHDPTQDDGVSQLKNKLDKDNVKGNTGGAPVKKSKADYIKEYADLMEIPIEEVDDSMTVKELQAEIETIKASKQE